MPVLRWPISVSMPVMRGVLIAAALSHAACKKPETVIAEEPFEASVARLGDRQVAIVDGTYIYASDIKRHAASQNLIEPEETLQRTDPRYSKVLDELIDQRLLSLDALKRSLDQREDTRRRLGIARERILGNIRVEEHLSDAVSEEAIRKLYDEQATLSREEGSSVPSFEDSRAELVKFMTYDEIQKLLQSLRDQGDVKLMLDRPGQTETLGKDNSKETP